MSSCFDMIDSVMGGKITELIKVTLPSRLMTIVNLMLKS